AMASFGRHLGLAFQLIDDVLDFAGDAKTLGKNVGDDLREGKATLPVLLAHARGDEADQAFWRRCIESRQVSESDVAEAINKVRDTGALQECRTRATAYAERAVKDLATSPKSVMRDILEDVVYFTISRLS
ncbi:MAG: polyprenyl synthetase family protein, partial [Pseudomonadota bacterium]